MISTAHFSFSEELIYLQGQNKTHPDPNRIEQPRHVNTGSEMLRNAPFAFVFISTRDSIS